MDSLRLETLLREVKQHQQQKQQDYDANDGFPSHKLLGLRGQFSDIWRKIPKLYKALWLGQKLTGEQPREILLDLIGHCLLSIDLLDSEADRNEGLKLPSFPIRQATDGPAPEGFRWAEFPECTEKHKPSWFDWRTRKTADGPRHEHLVYQDNSPIAPPKGTGHGPV